MCVVSKYADQEQLQMSGITIPTADDWKLYSYLKGYKKKINPKEVMLLHDRYHKYVTTKTLPVALGEDTLKPTPLVAQMYSDGGYDKVLIERFLIGMAVLATSGAIQKSYYLPRPEKANRVRDLKILAAAMAAVYILTKVKVI